MGGTIKLKADPRICAYPKRHALLAKEAKARKMSIQDVAEEKFLATDNK